MLDMREIREAEVRSDPDLGPTEKETTLTCPTDLDTCRIHTEIPVHIRWVLSVSEAEIQNFRTVDGAVVAVTAKIPKGLVLLKPSARKSDRDGAMVSKGEVR